MKHQKLSFCIGVLIIFYTSSFGQMEGHAIGGFVGEPTGLCGKYWLSPYTAIDGGLGISFFKPFGVQLHGDFVYCDAGLLNYLKLDKINIHLDSVRTSAHLGVGAKIKIGKSIGFGIRIPCGIDYIPRNKKNIDYYGELVPCLEMLPVPGIGINLGIGIRLFFNS